VDEAAVQAAFVGEKVFHQFAERPFTLGPWDRHKLQ
jgi:hypothetical protein